MADKTISVRLQATATGYISSMKSAATATKDFGTSVVNHIDTHQKSFQTVGSAAAVAGGLILAGLGAAVGAAAEFDSKMSLVKANIDNQSAPSMKRLAAAALDAGQKTAFSANDAADAEAELAKAGVSAADIIGGGLSASLNLASAGQISLESAASITASTMVQFGLNAGDAAKIADDLAAGADKSLGGVGDLGEALSYAGVTSSQFGLSLDDTVGVLAEFASNGITGSMAGTSLRQMLVQLANPTKEASGLMSDLGINAFDASGKFVGMAPLAQQLQDKLGGLSQQQRQAALATIFGSRSLGEANILYKDGAAGVSKWAHAVDDQGFAAKQAAEKTNNLAGDLNKLKGSFQVALIETGQQASGVLRGVVKDTTGLIQAYDQLGPKGKSVVAAVAGISGALLTLGGGAVLVIPKLVEFSKALQTITKTQSLGAAVKASAGALFSPWGLAAAAAAVTIGVFVAKKAHAAQVVGQFADAITQDTEAIGKNSGELGKNSVALGANTKAAVAQALANDGVLAGAKSLGLNLNTVTEAAEGSKGALDSINSQLKTARDNLISGWDPTDPQGLSYALTDFDTKAAKLTHSIGNQSSAVSKAKEKAEQLAEAEGKGAKSADGSASSHGKLGTAAEQAAAAQAKQADAAKEASDQIKIEDDAAKALSDSLRLLNGDALGVEDAQNKALDSLSELNKTLRSGKNSLNQYTTAGRASREALSSQINAYESVAEAVAKQTGSTEKGKQAFTEQIAALRANLKAHHELTPAVQEFLNKYAKVPAEVAAASKATDAGTASAKSLRAQIAALQSKKVKIEQSGAQDAKAKAAALQKQIDGLRGKLVKVEQSGAEGAKTSVLNLGGQINKLVGKTVNVLESGATDSKGRVSGLKGIISSLTGKTVGVHQTGSGVAWGSVNSLKSKVDDLHGKTISINQTGAGTAYSAIDALSRLINGIPAIKNIAVAVKTAGTSVLHSLGFAHGGPIDGYATGGPIQGLATGGLPTGHLYGPGTSTSDSFLIAASNDEFMINAAARSMYGDNLLNAINNRTYLTSDLVSAATRSLQSAAPIAAAPKFVHLANDDLARIAKVAATQVTVNTRAVDLSIERLTQVLLREQLKRRVGATR